MKCKEIRRKISNLITCADIIIGVPEAEGIAGYEMAFWNVRQGRKLMIQQDLSAPLVIASMLEGEEKKFIYADAMHMYRNKDYYNMFVKMLGDEASADIIGIYYGG